MTKHTIPWIAPSERSPDSHENGTPMTKEEIRKKGVQEYEDKESVDVLPR